MKDPVNGDEGEFVDPRRAGAANDGRGARPELELEEGGDGGRSGCCE